MNFKLYLLLLFCSLSSTVPADNYKIYSEDLNVKKGTVSSELNVFMTNEKTISALQFDITFPEGIDVFYGENEDEDMVYFITKGERAKSDHTVSYNKLSDRKYRVMVSSPTNSTFKESETAKSKPIAVITLDVATDVCYGIKDVTISDVVLSHYDSGSRITEPYYPDNSKSNIIVISDIPGDVNNDGQISVADLSMMASYILDATSVTLDKNIADVNGDNAISVADLSLLASKILSK